MTFVWHILTNSPNAKTGCIAKYDKFSVGNLQQGWTVNNILKGIIAVTCVFNLVPGILVLCKIWESNNLVSTSLRNSSRLIFPSSACCKFKMRKCKKKGKIGRWWKQWWLFCSPAKQYANRSVRNRSVCVDGNVVLWEIFEIVLQEISGFKIFSPRLLLALSLSNFPNLIW